MSDTPESQLADFFELYPNGCASIYGGHTKWSLAAEEGYLKCKFSHTFLSAAGVCRLFNSSTSTAAVVVQTLDEDMLTAVMVDLKRDLTLARWWGTSCDEEKAYYKSEALRLGRLVNSLMEEEWKQS